ncbi:MAG: SH3 domain-containing protein [Hungatella sp.]
MFNQKNHMAKLDKARRKRNGNGNEKYLLLALFAIALIVVGIFLADTVRRQVSEKQEAAATNERSVDQDTTTPSGETEAAEDLEAQKAQEELAQKQAVVDSYTTLGLVQVSGYLNVRKTPEPNGDIIGKLQENSACEIIGEEGEWYHITSGGVDGYISSQYVISGEEAREKALEQVKLRAIVTTDNLNIRKDPSLAPDNVVAQALLGERYEVLGQQEGWIQIPSGYISSEYAEVRYALNEARKLDLKAMAVYQYDNLVISKVNNYLNIRSSPKDEGNANIIGKFPSKAAGEILETVDGWYKIKSGDITGYISTDSQYTATGQEARDLAMNSATLMAIVNTDRLNVRVEPNTESKIWTQISKEERYPVVQQMDGWVQIELDTGEDGAEADKAYISTRDNNVEVRYALNEAIKFSPLEEQANQQASLRNQIVNYALKFVGNPYVWGGTSLTKGADCSGFTQSVLKNFGIYIPRVSRDQARAGRAVKSSEMRPGDLIFYTNSSGVVNHVAMYIGNGQVVHAASRRSGIKISTWNYRNPAAIRNVID